LAGSIAINLADPQTDHFAEEDVQFLKFHGIYQQDDRDLRKTGKKYIFMIRTKIPGGILKPEQYLALDKLASQYGYDSLRVTTRQTIQFHGVVKEKLAQTMKGINECLITTSGACGDIVRNVVAPTPPPACPAWEMVWDDARRLSGKFIAASPAYHDIWLEGKMLRPESPEQKNFVDPLYGKTYLPRKFKITFAIPPLNDVDILINCLGFIAIVENGNIVGYNMVAGGGMGKSHGNAETFPRIADVIGFLQREQIDAAAQAVVEIHRDFGDRVNRKHARLKYVVQDRGVDWFRQEVERRAGITFAPARSYQFTHQTIPMGWHEQFNGKFYFGMFVEHGRIKDTPGHPIKTVLRRIVEEFKPEVRLSPTCNLILANISPQHREAISKILNENGITNDVSPTRLASMACVALPTCGLALAESERYLPKFMTGFESLLAELGLAQEEIVIRMTGCPNGCARPYMAEIGFVGRSPGKYQIYLGGNTISTRVNRLYKDQVPEANIYAELKPVLQRFAAERTPGERFGDYCARVIWPEMPGSPA
jgi:sulfite reductase (NADPH) hemoprotein beta-component